MSTVESAIGEKKTVMHLIPMYIANGHLVSVSLLLWLFDFCFYGLCCFRENVATHVSGHFVLSRTHTQPLRRRCLSCHNVSRQREAAAERQSHLQLCTVHFWASLVFAVAQSHTLSLSLSTPLKKKKCIWKKKKTSTENVNTNWGRDLLKQDQLVYIPSFASLKHTLHSRSSSSANQASENVSLHDFCTSTHRRTGVSHPTRSPPEIRL